MMKSCSGRPIWRELADHIKIGEEQLAKELMTISMREFLVLPSEEGHNHTYPHCYQPCATRELLVHLPSEERQPHLSTLLPAMRYCVTEGVRLYSQETWRVVTQTRGVQLVEQHIHKMRGFLHLPEPGSQPCSERGSLHLYCRAGH
ncbi:uncharacterized protein LOC135349967 [Halichondria panicea]|uniref:uncharacterized protein LOC135349967 n=1 Tax=Halichondria panicea TaxID=6063 RepID=UPI00312BC67C